jgi:hypothetical protein
MINKSIGTEQHIMVIYILYNGYMKIEKKDVHILHYKLMVKIVQMIYRAYYHEERLSDKSVSNKTQQSILSCYKLESIMYQYLLRIITLNHQRM